jgi:hypothetical protein
MPESRSMRRAQSRTLSPESRAPFVALLALSVVALAVRFYAARTVGFGDSEALYASYALFPQPAYLDHPGLIGMIARWLGDGLAPSALVAHTMTAVATTLAPWATVLACRSLRATGRASLVAGLAVAVAPELSVGLFGMTPDLPLFYAWLAALALFGRALLSTAGSTEAAALFMAAGVALGIACASKVSGLTLGLALLLTLGARSTRPHARTIWPWAALALAAVVFAPVVLFEARTGWPMLRHRLVETQHDAGVSLRNAVAVLLGQTAYVSPVLCVSGIVLGRELLATRGRDVVRTLLANAVVVPLVALGPLCLWSRVAEPHWLAPVWLPLPLYFAYRAGDPDALLPGNPWAPLGPRMRRLGFRVGLAMTTLVYAWVLIPGLAALVPQKAYDPQLDIANELYGWREVANDVRQTVAAARFPISVPSDVVVVGPVWMVSAQLRALLPARIPVGCVGAETADFATWYPHAVWARAEIVVFVHDNRQQVDRAALFHDRVLIESHTRTITRGGRVARVFTIDVLGRRAAG